MSTQTALRTRLRITLRDPNGDIFTDDELNEALATAMTDSQIANQVMDSSLTASTSTQSYSLPSTVDVIRKIKITYGSRDYDIDNDSWELTEDGKIFFRNYPPLAGTMKLYGFKQYTSSDDINDKYDNLVLALGAYNAWEILLNNYATGILMSDITLAEITQGMNRFDTKISRERSKVPGNKGRD